MIAKCLDVEVKKSSGKPVSKQQIWSDSGYTPCESWRLQICRISRISIAKWMFRALEFLSGFLWLTVIHSEDGQLADQRGMLLTEVGLRHQLIFEYLLSLTAEQRQALHPAVHQLSQLASPTLNTSSVGLRDLGVLKGLADVGIFDLIATLEGTTALHTINRTSYHTMGPHQSRAQWLRNLATDLRWLMRVLPRGDRALVAIAHAVATHVMFSSLGADSDGYVRIESMSSITQAWWLAEQAAFAPTRNICEVGFNGGHSALAMLLSAPADAKMLSFDLMSKSYTPSCQRLVRLAFPHRHRLVEGLSNVSIPRFVRANLHTKCDLIFIDGGHEEEEAQSDLLHMSMLATEKTLLVMDDVGCQSSFCEGPTRAWKSFVLSGRILELGCQEETERRWCWGTYQRWSIEGVNLGAVCSGKMEWLVKACKSHHSYLYYHQKGIFLFIELLWYTCTYYGFEGLL